MVIQKQSKVWKLAAQKHNPETGCIPGRGLITGESIDKEIRQEQQGKLGSQVARLY